MLSPAPSVGLQRRSLIALGLALFCVWLISFCFPETLESLEERSSDRIWRSLADARTERRIVIVDIDEASLARLGPWPWPRERIERISHRLAEEGAALQIYDIFLPTSKEGDESLAATLARNRSVLSQVFSIHGAEAQQGKLAGALGWSACPPVFPDATYYLANAPVFSGLSVGHITPRLTGDGSVRSQPAIICHDSKAYPALFLTAALAGTGGDRLDIAAEGGPLAPAWTLRGIPFSRRGIPLDQEGNVRIPWLIQPEALLSVSAGDLLDGRVPAGLLENAWVLVGSTALGINDRVATPFSNLGAGLMVHAELLVGLLEDAIPVPPRLAWLYESLAGLLGVLGLYFLSWRSRNRVYGLLIGAVAVALLLFGLKALLLARFSLWLSWVCPALFAAGFALNLSALEYAWSRRERDRIYSHLSSYLPRPVAAALAVQEPSGAIDAVRMEVIVLCADIRNFSAYCERRPPKETTAVLHAFFSAASDIVDEHGGVIESIQGDAILAVWRTGGASGREICPLAEAALAAGLALIQRAQEFLPTIDDPPLAELALGVGMESGPSTVGSFGPARRRTHLAMGRPVSLAARLEKMTVELAHPLLIGENLAAYLGAHRLESQGVFLLDGMAAPCHIYAYPYPYPYSDPQENSASDPRHVPAE